MTAKEPVPLPRLTLRRRDVNSNPQPVKIFFSAGCELADDLVSAVANRHRPEGGGGETQAGEQRSERRPQRAGASVLDLQREAQPLRAGCAEEALRPALRDPAGHRLHEIGV